MLTDDISPKSTYFPATVWLTVFTGNGGKLGQTTNDCWRGGPNGRFAAKVLSLSGTGTEAPAVIDMFKIGKHGVAKVATKDGAIKVGLLCEVAGEELAFRPGKVPPEAKKVVVLCEGLDCGVGTPPEAACSSMVTE